MNESNRQRKVSRMVQKELSEILHHGFDMPKDAMTTISVVRSTADLGLCRIYTSVFPDARRTEMVEYLNANHVQIRKLLAARIRNKIRTIPEIAFYEDDSLEYAAKMDDLFKGLTPKKKDEDEAKEDGEA